MRNKAILLLNIVILILFCSQLNADLKNVLKLFLNPIPTHWVKTPNQDVLKIYNSLNKLDRYDFDTKHKILLRYNLDKSTAPDLPVVEIELVPYKKDDNISQSIIRNVYKTFAKKFFETRKKIFLQNTDPSIVQNIRFKNRIIDYKLPEDCILIDYILCYTYNYEPVEIIQKYRLFFTKDSAAVIVGSFWNDSISNKYITEFNNYINSISIPQKHKITHANVINDDNNTMNPLLIIIILFSIIIYLFLYYKTPKKNKLLKSKSESNSIFPKPISFIFTYIFKILIRSLIGAAFGGAQSSHASNSSDVDIDSSSDFQLTNVSDASDNAELMNVDNTDMESDMDNTINLDNHLSNDSKLDDILSDDTNIDDYLSSDSDLYDKLSGGEDNDLQGEGNKK